MSSFNDSLKWLTSNISLKSLYIIIKKTKKTNTARQSTCSFLMLIPEQLDRVNWPWVGPELLMIKSRDHLVEPPRQLRGRGTGRRRARTGARRGGGPPRRRWRRAVTLTPAAREHRRGPAVRVRRSGGAGPTVAAWRGWERVREWETMR
jgi:hypothetical protein